MYIRIISQLKVLTLKKKTRERRKTKCVNWIYLRNMKINKLIKFATEFHPILMISSDYGHLHCKEKEEMKIFVSFQVDKT